MDEQTELRQAMSVVRSRGLANADVLAKRVERLSDWREHVRAHPLPIALAAAALGYWLVPIRPRQLPPPPAGTGTATGTGASGFGATKSGGETESAEKKAHKAGLGGMALGFAATLIGNAVRSYVNEQIQTLIHSRGNDGTPQQQRQAYSARN